MKTIVAAFAACLTASALIATPALARHGADDATGEVRGGKGKDDGAGHTSLQQNPLLLIARHGADDPAGDDRGGTRKRKGGSGRGGADDGPNHA